MLDILIVLWLFLVLTLSIYWIWKELKRARDAEVKGNVLALDKWYKEQQSYCKFHVVTKESLHYIEPKGK